MEAGVRRRRGRWEGDVTATEEVCISQRGRPEGSGAGQVTPLPVGRVFREAGEDVKAALLRLTGF